MRARDLPAAPHRPAALGWHEGHRFAVLRRGSEVEEPRERARAAAERAVLGDVRHPLAVDVDGARLVSQVRQEVRAGSQTLSGHGLIILSTSIDRGANDETLAARPGVAMHRLRSHRAGLAQPADAPHRAVRARRRDRHPGAPARAEAAGGARPAGRDREPHRRGRHHRHAGRRASAARRLHAPHGDQRRDRHASLDLPEAAVRSAERPGAGFDHRGEPDAARRAAGQPVQHGGGPRWRPRKRSPARSPSRQPAPGRPATYSPR